MSFKHRKSTETEERPSAEEGPGFRHASGASDLASLLGEHSLNSAQIAAIIAPKGYRARSVTKTSIRH